MVPAVSAKKAPGRFLPWIVLACLVVPMFASYFFDDMFSSISYIFENPSALELGWNSFDYGSYAGAYSVLCVFGGLVVGGILLDKWGIRVTGSVFVGMMVLGAAVVWYALRSGLPSGKSLGLAYVGCMFFGLGSEIAGTTVVRSIAKWFKGGHMAFAMGLQLAVARLGTAAALILSPLLVSQKLAGETYSLAETARPAAFGLVLMALGIVLWSVFVAIDLGASKSRGLADGVSEEEPFRLSDVWKVLTNKNFIMLGLLCVLFYSSIIAFKKFAGAILIPRFSIPAETAGWMVSTLPFACVVLAPLFGFLVDKKGKGTRWMIAGSVLALASHLLLALAPQGVPFYGYLSMILLGFGYSLVPAALWPSLPRIVPDKVLGTAYSLLYWVQNLGLLAFKMLAGKILESSSPSEAASFNPGPFRVEVMFVILCIAALATALLFARSSDRHPELGLDGQV